MSDLAGHVALHDEACDGSSDGWSTWLTEAGHAELSFAGHITFSDSFLLLDAAVARQGVALGRARLIDDDLKAERLIRLPGPCLREMYAYWLVRAGGSNGMSSAMEAFRKWVRAEANQCAMIET